MNKYERTYLRGCFYDQTTAKPKRTGRERRSVGKRHGGIIPIAYPAGRAADPRWSAAGKLGESLRACMLRSCGACVRVRFLFEEEGRICVHSPFCAHCGADPSSARSLYSNERLEFRLRSENAVRYDISYVNCVFHKNKQK